mgnify:CR=1 FL=1
MAENVARQLAQDLPDLQAYWMPFTGNRYFKQHPRVISRAKGMHCYTHDGKELLDAVAGLWCCNAGHCHPKIVEAIKAQASTLNTHTRYLHEGMLDYVERLTGTMDPSLSTAILTCTGSEANDIALRMAEGITGKRGIIATDATYHGNTALVSQLSRNNVPKFGFGLEQFFRFVPAPDSYRNPDPDAAFFVAALEQEIAALEADGTGFAALLICPMF